MNARRAGASLMLVFIHQTAPNATSPILLCSNQLQECQGNKPLLSQQPAAGPSSTPTPLALAPEIALCSFRSGLFAPLAARNGLEREQRKGMCAEIGSLGGSISVGGCSEESVHSVMDNAGTHRALSCGR